MIKTCPICGKKFGTTNKVRKYCGSYCAKIGKARLNYRYRKDSRASQPDTKEVECKMCGKTFTKKVTQRRMIYCSDECRRAAAKGYHEKYKETHPERITRNNKRSYMRRNGIDTYKMTCPVCLDVFTAKRIDQKYCGNKCRSAAHHGEKYMLNRRDRVREELEKNTTEQSRRSQVKYGIKHIYRSFESSARMAEKGFNYGDYQKQKTLEMLKEK